MSLPQNQLPVKTSGCSKQQLALTNRCCLITGVGRSAVAVVAVQGPDAIRAVSHCFRPANPGEFVAGQVRYGFWGDQANPSDAMESVVVTPLSNRSIEIHCHGGTAATARIMADLRARDVETVDHSTWHRGQQSLLIEEATEVLARCLTVRTAAIALDQVRGALYDWALDNRQRAARSDCSPDRVRSEANGILQWAPLGLRLTEPLRIVLVGPPNVGKSSLLNAMVGYDRSITFDGAGTTRDVLHAETVIDGWPVRLSDTAGIRESDEPIEREGIVRARDAADRADLLLCVVEPALLEATTGDSPIDVSPLATQHIPMIRVLNKSDLWNRQSRHAKESRPDRQPADTDGGPFDLYTNAISGEGIEALMEMISRRLHRQLPEPQAPVPINQRQVECLRAISDSATPEVLVESLAKLLGFTTMTDRQ